MARNEYFPQQTRVLLDNALDKLNDIFVSRNIVWRLQMYIGDREGFSGAGKKTTYWHVNEDDEEYFFLLYVYFVREN